MRKKLILASAILMLVLSACKNESSGSENDNTTKNNFTVVLEGVFAKNDKFQVYYMLQDKWSEENSVFTTVYASDKMQKIDIELPEGVKPQNIRVDLGVNETQTNITLKNISVKYKGYSIDGDNDKFTKFFYHNEYITWDNNYFGYKLARAHDYYDPFFVGNDLLVAKLKQMK